MDQVHDPPVIVAQHRSLRFRQDSCGKRLLDDRLLQHIVGNIITLWFFLTPVLYSSNQVLEKAPEHPVLVNVLLYGNPMAVLIRSYQAIFYDHVTPELVPLAGVLALSVVLLWISAHVFETRREEFAELV